MPNKKLISTQTVIWWGRYKGLPVDVLVSEEPEYILILHHSKFFSIDGSLLYEAQKRLPTNHYLLKEQTYQPLDFNWREKLSFQQNN